ncbi:MAG: 1,4-alpha-glucan branching protein GlgB [Blautia sp.]|nr:1,4-alpha-glucan branching protein GlgB [Blautia sp.]
MGEKLQFTEFDQYLLGQGTHYDVYKKLGAHPTRQDGEDGVYFAVWAPNAQSVNVIGEFNNWDTQANKLEKAGPIGVFEGFVPAAHVGQLYKYFIIGMHGEELYKSDPYGFECERRPGTASRIADITDFTWTDEEWMQQRLSFDEKKDAMAIYEVHPGSWMKHPWAKENEEGFYNYRELAIRLTQYVKEMGYTHVELMGIAEHPFDGSWGYQVTGYYAPTSRHGSPLDFKYLINHLHRNNIGVILDWVPAHFPKDAHGLANFDGTAVYEHEDPRQGEHPDWGTKIFNYGRPEVKNFLIANALFWLEEYHADGLRVDAVASMLYLDYGKRDGQWVANKYGGNENLEAIEFFKHLNSCLLGRNHGSVMIAEESTAWPKVTGRPEDDGLGFSLKWNMGWMNDFLEYMKLDPYFRKFNHNMMTFSLTYAYSEKYILVLSHDEVVHLKCSMLSKMPGELDEKFKNLKVGYTYMFGHPGKKLLFMGQDFGQLREWSEEREIDWFLLEEKPHQKLQGFVRDLLSIYKKYPALYAMDADSNGFEWINADDADRSIFSFVRKAPLVSEEPDKEKEKALTVAKTEKPVKAGKGSKKEKGTDKSQRQNLLFICNFTPVDRPDYRVGVPEKKTYTQIMDEHGLLKAKQKFKAVESECDRRPYSFDYPLPAYGIAIFTY